MRQKEIYETIGKVISGKESDMKFEKKGVAICNCDVGGGG